MTPLVPLSIALACVFPSLMAVLNLLTAPRLRAASPGTNDYSPKLSASLLIPIRNEAERLESLLTQLRAVEDRWPELEILFLDDGSTDDGPQRVRAAGFQVVTGDPLPEGWLGKNWACHQLSQRARHSKVLIFMDADVCPKPEAVGSTLAVLARNPRVGALTALPAQRMFHWIEQAVIPWIMHLSILGTVPLALSRLLPWPSLTVANGQWFAFRRECYEAIGGHVSVRGKVLEDMALGRRVKGETRFQLLTTLASNILEVRMYSDTQSLREGFGKNLYLLAGRSVPGLFLCSVALMIWGFGPVLVLMASGSLRLASVALGGIAIFRLAAILAFRSSPASALLHPLGALSTLWLLWRSAFLHQTGKARWKGRLVSISLLLMLWSLGALVGGSSSVRAEEVEAFHCEDAQWRRPAESDDGVFLGDLELKCVTPSSAGSADFAALEKAIREKLVAESKIFSTQDQIRFEGLAGRSWDVGREIRDGDNPVKLREEALLATDGKSRLVYKTKSKSVEGKGMASYLRSVDFEAQVSRADAGSIEMKLINTVRVQRPWYALDLMFAPIARGVCRDKMKTLRDQLVPWFRAQLLGLVDPKPSR